MTLLGCLGDLHIRATAPINRTDNYYQTQFSKLEQAFKEFKKQRCEVVLQPGDFFNSYGRDPYDLVYATMELIKLYGLKLYSVMGQHDVKFHNIEATDLPIKVLYASELIKQLQPEPMIFGNIYLYGVNWNQKIPKPVNKKGTHILVMHKMITNNKKLWGQQTDYTHARMLKKQNPGFDLFVCGDNHQAFVYENVVNCGSLCRMSTDQIEHEPMFCIYDTETKEIQQFKYEIQPAESVMRMEVFSEALNTDRKSAFAASLNSDFKAEINFRNNIQTVLKQRRRTKPRTKELISEALNAKG